MAKQFPHLREIAEEIPPDDPEAAVEILIGKDAPELLKVRASRNGPKGAPWGQKLDLGWTVSGQMCLDRVGGPIHISARRTEVNHLEEPIWSATPQYQVVPCPNYFKIKEKFSNKAKIGADLYRTTADDNMIGMS